MSTVDDIRELFQDLIAPELRSISVRLDGFEKRVDESLVALGKRVDERFAASDKRMDERFAAADRRFTGIDERFVTLENRVTALDARVGDVGRQITQQLEALDYRVRTNQVQIIGALQQLSDYDRLAQRVSAIEEQKEPQAPRSGH